MTADRLDLVFKGARPYVHGTTIWDATTRLLAHAGYDTLRDVEFSIHKMTDSNLRLVMVPRNDPHTDTEAVAMLRFVSDNKSMQASIRNDAGKPGGRIAYDESLISACCEIDHAARSITLSKNNTAFTPMEILVSMTKILHLAVLKKPDDTHWVFCRWCTPAWPPGNTLTGLAVHLKHAVGTRLTRSSVILGGRQIGLIDFSAKVAS